MGKSRWVLPAAGAALVAAFFAAAGSPALQGPRKAPTEDWGGEARAAAQKSIIDRAQGESDVRFADVEVRRNGNDDERWVCGSFAVWDDEGSLGPYHDFWITVARVPATWADIRTVHANEFARDDFLDRNSAYFRACFADGEVG